MSLLCGTNHRRIDHRHLRSLVHNFEHKPRHSSHRNWMQKVSRSRSHLNFTTHKLIKCCSFNEKRTKTKWYDGTSVSLSENNIVIYCFTKKKKKISYFFWSDMFLNGMCLLCTTRIFSKGDIGAKLFYSFWQHRTGETLERSVRAETFHAGEFPLQFWRLHAHFGWANQGRCTQAYFRSVRTAFSPVIPSLL